MISSTMSTKRPTYRRVRVRLQQIEGGEVKRTVSKNIFNASLEDVVKLFDMFLKSQGLTE